MSAVLEVYEGRYIQSLNFAEAIQSRRAELFNELYNGDLMEHIAEYEHAQFMGWTKSQEGNPDDWLRELLALPGAEKTKFYKFAKNAVNYAVEEEIRTEDKRRFKS